ncbi:hypothetical protein ACNQUF_12255, partial [Corynebacterium diphtheriae]
MIPDMLRQVRVDEGLFWSVNTPTVATAYQLDLCDITSLTTSWALTRALDSSPLQPDDPSFLLGKDSVAPLSAQALRGPDLAAQRQPPGRLRGRLPERLPHGHAL